MSRTRQTDPISNPAQLFIRWSSGDWQDGNKTWEYWDKEEKKSVLLPQDTPFIVLDMLNTLTGYISDENAAVYANEVRNIKTQPFVVFAGKKKIAEGLYEEVKSKEVEFAKSVYALAKIDGEYKLVNFRLKGCAVSEWFDFVKDIGGTKTLYGDTVVAVTDVKQEKNGATKYNAPVFSIVSRKLSPEAREMADEADKMLQEYLDDYLHRDKAHHVEEHVEQHVEEEEEDPPFDQPEPEDDDENPPF